jgi:hypothetical protein
MYLKHDASEALGVVDNARLDESQRVLVLGRKINTKTPSNMSPPSTVEFVSIIMIRPRHLMRFM